MLEAAVSVSPQITTAPRLGAVEWSLSFSCQSSTTPAPSRAKQEPQQDPFFGAHWQAHCILAGALIHTSGSLGAPETYQAITRGAFRLYPSYRLDQPHRHVIRRNKCPFAPVFKPHREGVFDVCSRGPRGAFSDTRDSSSSLALRCPARRVERAKLSLGVSVVSPL